MSGSRRDTVVQTSDAGDKIGMLLMRGSRRDTVSFVAVLLRCRRGSNGSIYMPE